MNADVAKQWAAALHSGKYTQGFDRLHKNDAFCVLGVLCDILNPEGWKKDPIVGGWSMDKQSTKLPDSVILKAELRYREPEVNGQSFVYLNDKQRLTFGEFAAIIENHWEEL